MPSLATLPFLATISRLLLRSLPFIGDPKVIGGPKAKAPNQSFPKGALIMRWSQYFLYTSREVPADAEVISHQLMSRAGMLRKHAAGIYSFLPFGLRSMSKMMGIVRRELDAVGCQELEMPVVQPAELWQESKRWRKYGKELLRVKDRHGRDFCLGPTHEEVVTDLVRRNVKSYRQLPLNLYQIQTKFRDEIRPRFGLMRGREFMMKDAYSFHADDTCMDDVYQAMHGAYSRIVEACGLDYIVVDADSGTIGGSSSHEFMVLADTGESAVIRCKASGYAANVEKAVTKLETPEAPASDVLEEVATPGLTTVEQVAKHLGVDPSQMVKTLIYEHDGGIVAVAIRGDREVNEVKLKNVLDAEWLRLADAEKVSRATNAPVGFAGPVGLSVDRLIADTTTQELKNFACGANKVDAHLTGVNWGRDAEVTEFADVLMVVEGDADVESGEPLETFRGIEVGHIFKLGTSYSEAMNCNFAAEEGPDKPMIMGCYGLGIGRTVAAAIEQNHDKDGIIWPLPLAPFQVLLSALNPAADDAVREVAERLYGDLETAGYEVLYDDREMSPGAKFKDADLIGLPLRVVVGSRSLSNGGVEFSLRRAPQEREIVAVGDIIERLGRALEELS